MASFAESVAAGTGASCVGVAKRVAITGKSLVVTRGSGK